MRRTPALFIVDWLREYRRLKRLPMRGITSSVALAVCLLGCGGVLRQQVPLITVDVLVPDSCWLLYRVVDVIADPTFGTVVKGDGSPLKWPTGFTAWRAGSEVEVRDPAGNVVLTTGGRYRISPANNGGPYDPDAEWIASCPRPCPDCELGSGLL
jgi:hypothetical protein